MRNAGDGMISCELCGEPVTLAFPYLLLDQQGVKSKIAGRVFPYLPSGLVPDRHRRVHALVNMFGNRKIAWCDRCSTGFVHPPFSERQLDAFYSGPYWSERGYSVQSPLALSFERAENHIAYLQDYLPGKFSSVLDFGCGLGEFILLMKEKYPAYNLCALDKSDVPRAALESKGIRLVSALCEVDTKLDLLYASHSIEHVPDIDAFFVEAQRHLQSGALMFFEVPNIANRAVCEAVRHTPHTYMLSAGSFRQLARKYGLDLLQLSEHGRSWSEIVEGAGRAPDIKCHLRAVLRFAG
jgi:ubiquinone/menaquinone biosynthesis C-methylase UbiE